MKFANPDNVDMPMSNAFCRECGCLFFFPENMGTAAELEGRVIYCPNGHGQTLNPLDTAAAYRELQTAFHDYQKRHACAAQAENAGWARISKRHIKRVRKLQGEIKRLKRAAAVGRCPLCKVKTNFQARHMEALHPRFYQLFAAVKK